MNKTKIEWTNYTWNPITGCTKGCSYCYARQIATRFKGSKAFPNGFEPTFHENRLSEPLAAPAGSKIFTCSMGELFSDDIGKGLVEMVLKTIRYCESKTFQVLTKQPQNLLKWSPFPDNCWVGVSATNEIMASAACAWLSKVEAKVKFISLEPLLSWDRHNATNGRIFWQENCHDINWLIIGAQTPVSPKTNPDYQTVEQIVTHYRKADIPIFLKDNLWKAFININPLSPMLKATKYGQVLRQEFPKL